MFRLVVIALGTLAAGPALAGSTPWQEIAPGVRARLVSADHVQQGTVLAGIELDLPAGTNTYWRLPGETGIPTQIDFSASRGAGPAADILWPYPIIDRSRGYLDYVYRQDVVLPVRVALSGEGAVLNAAISLGVCSDMCIPAEASFSLPVGAGPDRAEEARLQIALAEVPIGWDRPGQPFGTASLSADGGSLELRDPDFAIDPTSLIVDAGDPAIFFAPPQKSRDGTVWTLTPLGHADIAGLEGRPIRLTFRTAMGPYEVTRTVAPAAP